MTEYITNEEARKLFEDAGFTYSDVKLSDALLLATMIQENFERIESYEDSERMVSTMRVHPKIKFKTDDEGNMTSCFIRCDSHYFDKREAISFNADGFIGFCGWASTCNSQPILEAWRDWLESKPKEACNA